MKNLEKYINEYIDESLELLDSVCDEFIELEKDDVEDNANIYKSIYRSMHTIKGSSQLYGIHHVGNVAHGLETCLDSVRKGNVTLTKTLLDRILVAIDYIRKKLETLYDHSKLTKEYLQADTETLKVICSVFAEISENFDLLKLADLYDGANLNLFSELDDIRQNKKLLSAEDSKISDDSKQSENVDEKAVVNVPQAKPAQESKPAASSGQNQEQKRSKSSFVRKKKVSLDEIEGVKFGAFDPPPKKKNQPSKLDSDKKDVETETTSQDKPIQNEEQCEGTEHVNLSNELSADSSQDQVNETVRVPVRILNNLMNLIGELILIRNQLQQLNHQDRQYGDVFSLLGQNLNVLTNKLQNEILKTRLQPINMVLSKLKRSVRDYSRKADKVVRLDISGQHTEVDKTILESIEEPICQLAKIAVLTGIETQKDRVKSGKSEQGIISVNATREGGQIIVTIADDGYGQDLKKIKNEAIKQKLISHQEADRLDEKNILHFLFAPNISKNIYQDCGYECRLDLVKESLEKFGGSIEIQSNIKKGTIYTLKLPLTLTILPALIVKANEDMFVIPQANLVELSRIEINEKKGELDWLGGSPIYKQRGRILPLLFLNDILGGKKSANRDIFENMEEVNLVVLAAGNCRFGLVVDEIINSTDIVIKPLIKFLTKSTIYSGATIMGDGRIALTLDVLRLANLYNLMQNADQSQNFMKQGNDANSSLKSELNEYLLIDMGMPGYYGIPLKLVNRLEEIDKSKVFYKGRTKAINYRQKVMPLLSNDDIVEHDNYKLIVLKMSGNFYGLQVLDFLDIITSENSCQESEMDEENIMGSIIYNEKIINILDVDKMVEKIKEKPNKRVA